MTVLQESFDVPEAQALLLRTPAVLDAWLRGLPEAWLSATEGPGTWSPYDVVGHLIHGERTDWMPRVRTILEHGADRPFEPFDRLAQFEESAGRRLDDLLDTFATLRHANVAALSSLALEPADLDRRGIDTTPGRCASSCG
jgi:hypothetical protein